MPPNKNNKQKYSFQLQRDQGADLTTNCNTWKHKIARIVDDLGEWREVKPKSQSNEKQSIMACKALVCSETRNIRYVQKRCSSVQFSSVQSLSHVWFFVTPWTAAHQASLSFTNSQTLLKLMSIGSAISSNHLILHHPLLLLPSIFPSIRIFSKKSVLHTRWPKYWSFSSNTSPSNEYSGPISFRMDWFDLLAV